MPSKKKSPQPYETKPAANKANPPKPTTKRDKLDVDRADSEGMAQPQGKRPAKKVAAKKAVPKKTKKKG